MSQTTSSQPEPRAPRRRQRRPMSARADFLLRHQLLEVVPLGMSTIDLLERRGEFPSRFRLEPTTRVAWKRHEVEKFMAARAAKPVHKKGLTQR
jgi:predicted DNA-binding transcriptional regulator AlpA